MATRGSRLGGGVVGNSDFGVKNCSGSLPLLCEVLGSGLAGAGGVEERVTDGRGICEGRSAAGSCCGAGAVDVDGALGGGGC